MENSQNQKSNSIGNLMNPALAFMQKSNAKARKSVKPKYARFKASIKYFDSEHYKSMYSYDWNKIYDSNGNAIGKDHEEIGFGKLCKWILKCMGDGAISNVKIFVTLSPAKSTDVMNYDTIILEWNDLMGHGLFQPHPSLAFDVNGKCILSKLQNTLVSKVVIQGGAND